jgi:hypothetical protein
MLLLQDLMNTSTLKTSLNHSTGETSQMLTTSLGLKTSTFPCIVAAAGLKEQLAQLLIVSTSLEIELGLMSHFPLKSLSTVKQEEAAMEETLQVFTPLLRLMVFLRKVAKTIWPRILRNSVALPFKNAKTALIPRLKSLEIREIVGQLPNIPSGKSVNTVQFQVLIT